MENLYGRRQVYMRRSRRQRSGQQVLQSVALCGNVAREVSEMAAIGHLVQVRARHRARQGARPHLGQLAVAAALHKR